MKTSLSREGIYYLFVVFVVLLGAMLREVNLLLLFAAFLCSPIIIAWILGRASMRHLKVQRKLPLRLFAGETFIIHLEVENQRPKKRNALSCWGLVVVDRIRPVFQSTPFEPAVYFEFVPNSERRRKSYSGRLPQRGRYTVGPVRIATHFPFGFLKHHWEIPTAKDEASEFFVFPKLGRLSAQWRTREHEAAEHRERRHFQPSHVSGEFLGVRRWQHGDLKKAIHWRASAKHGEPIVRQFERNQNKDCAVILDLFLPPEHRDEAGAVYFELAISFAATLITETTKRGGLNLFFITTSKYDEPVSGPVSSVLVDTILKQLALVKPIDDDSDQLTEVILKTLANTEPSCELVFITSRSIDLLTSRRLAAVQNDARFRSIAQRLRIVDTSDAKLDEIFSAN